MIHLLKVRTICPSQIISGKRNQPHVESVGSPLFVCLFYKVVNDWKELSSKVRKVYNNQD